jgi:hypothetical protein
MNKKVIIIIVIFISFALVLTTFSIISSFNKSIIQLNNGNRTSTPTIHRTHKPFSTNSPFIRTPIPSNLPTRSKKPTYRPNVPKNLTVFYDETYKIDGYSIGDRQETTNYCRLLANNYSLPCENTPMIITYKDESIIHFPFIFGFLISDSMYFNDEYIPNWESFIYNSLPTNDYFWTGGIRYNFIFGNCGDWTYNSISTKGIIATNYTMNSLLNYDCTKKYNTMCLCIDTKPTRSPTTKLPTLRPTRPTSSPFMIRKANITAYSDNELYSGILGDRITSDDLCNTIKENLICNYTTALLNYQNDEIVHIKTKYAIDDDYTIYHVNRTVLGKSFMMDFSSIVNHDIYWKGNQTSNCNEWSSTENKGLLSNDIEDDCISFHKIICLCIEYEKPQSMTDIPTLQPTLQPSKNPTVKPSLPTIKPTKLPSLSPSISPSLSPSL